MLHSRILLLSFLNSQIMKTQHVHSTCLPCHSTESTGGLQDDSCPLGAAVALRMERHRQKQGIPKVGCIFPTVTNQNICNEKAYKLMPSHFPHIVLQVMVYCMLWIICRSKHFPCISFFPSSCQI